jgi:hypothetical protein
VPADRTLPCPKCSTLIAIPPVGVALMDRESGEVTGAALKRCPECLTWSWISPERQPAG